VRYDGADRFDVLPLLVAPTARSRPSVTTIAAYGQTS